MPGILGIITKRPSAWADERVARMLSVLHHKDSYVSGTWSSETAGAYLAWVAHKGSFADSMPRLNERGDSVLFFAGEEYPDPALVSRLRADGHAVADAPADYLVHCAEESSSFPAELNGRFHGLLVDLRDNSALLFNDRYGMNRVYYHETPDAFYFAPEAKALLAVLPELRSADPRGLGEFTSCGCVMENRTLFRDIMALPPGSAWTFRQGAPASRKLYFHPEEWESLSPLGDEEYYQQLRAVFSANLPRYFQGPEPIAVSLTGGLDTRMVLAWHKAAPGTLPSYTFGGPYGDCQDVRIARKVARLTHQPHQVIPVGREFLSNFAHYAERAVYLSDGGAAVNRGADLYANELAAQIAPVRMTGNYGSEILRRLPAFKPSSPSASLFTDDFLAEVQRAGQTYSAQREGHAVSFTAFRQAPWYQYGLLALEQTQIALRSPFLDNDLVRTAFRAPDASMARKDIFEDNTYCSRLIADGDPALQRLRTDRGLGGVPGSWITPVVRAYQEFTFRAEYAYDYGMPQWLARVDHAFAPLHLERLFLGRHKFCHFRVWYRDALAGFVKEILLDQRTLRRPYLHAATLEQMVTHHLRGDRNYTTEITRLLTLELQHRLFFDSI